MGGRSDPFDTETHFQMPVTLRDAQAAHCSVWLNLKWGCFGILRLSNVNLWLPIELAAKNMTERQKLLCLIVGQVTCSLFLYDKFLLNH